MTETLLLLDNPIQNYEWGSRDAIAELLGRPAPATRPEAELWIGAHPKAPSRILGTTPPQTLDRMIAAAPRQLLGPAVLERAGPTLPFLLKVLAAAAPLSIQAHPNLDQARRGFARENAAGIAPDAPQRNYRDANHKPELVCALTPFHALKGFRPAAEIVDGLGPIAVPELAGEVAGLSDAPDSLRALLQRLLTLAGAAKEALLSRVRVESARRTDPRWSWVARLLARYPADTGVLAPLYLNLLRLEPGEALYLPAGDLHAYLEGTALEIMASSDNVLRGGLTPKHVDVAELLSILTFASGPAKILRSVETAPGFHSYPTPAAEFELSLVELAAGHGPLRATPTGVEILLSLSGGAEVRGGGVTVPLERGRSLLVPGTFPEYELRGAGRLARARVPV